MKRFGFFALVVLLLGGCTKEGLGGTATLEGVAAHHSDAIPATRVYIKYGTQLSPGIDPTVYDDNTVADIDGKFKFRDLQKGEYYIFGIGDDAATGEEVRGGLPVEIKSGATKVVELAITE